MKIRVSWQDTDWVLKGLAFLEVFPNGVLVPRLIYFCVVAYIDRSGHENSRTGGCWNCRSNISIIYISN